MLLCQAVRTANASTAPVSVDVSLGPIKVEAEVAGDGMDGLQRWSVGRHADALDRTTGERVGKDDLLCRDDRREPGAPSCFMLDVEARPLLVKEAHRPGHGVLLAGRVDAQVAGMRTALEEDDRARSTLGPAPRPSRWRHGPPRVTV